MPPGFPSDVASSFLGVAQSFRGDCLLALGRIEDALDAFRRSCEIDPGSVACWQLAAFALKGESSSLAREAMRYVPRIDARESAVMALNHRVDLEALRLLAERA